MIILFEGLFSGPLVAVCLFAALAVPIVLCLLFFVPYLAAIVFTFVFTLPYLVWRARPAAQEVPVVELRGMQGYFHEMANAARLYLHWMTGRPHSIKSFAIR